MKIQFVQFIFILAMSLAIFTGFSNGPAAIGIDRTGSPLSGGSTCTDCHGVGTGATIFTAKLLENGNPITSYIPGQVYTLEMQVTNPAFPVFGGQAVILDSANVNVGTMNPTPLTPNTQISTLQGTTYLEHNSQSPTGLFQTAWTAPPAGTGTITLYAIGMAVQGTPTWSDAATPIALSIPESVGTNIVDYQNNTNLSVNIYPNPTQHEQFNLQNQSSAGTTSLEIYNMLGQLLLTESFYFEENGVKGVELPVNSPRGVYFIKIQQKDRRANFPLLYEQ